MKKQLIYSRIVGIIILIMGVYLIMYMLCLMLWKNNIHWAPILIIHCGVGFLLLSTLMLREFNVHSNGIEKKLFLGIYKTYINNDSIKEYNIKKFGEDETIYLKLSNKNVTFLSLSNTKNYEIIQPFLQNQVFFNKKLKLNIWNTSNILYLSAMIPIIIWMILDLHILK